MGGRIAELWEFPDGFPSGSPHRQQHLASLEQHQVLLQGGPWREVMHLILLRKLSSLHPPVVQPSLAHTGCQAEGVLPLCPSRPSSPPYLYTWTGVPGQGTTCPLPVLPLSQLAIFYFHFSVHRHPQTQVKVVSVHNSQPH